MNEKTVSAITAEGSVEQKLYELMFITPAFSADEADKVLTHVKKELSQMGAEFKGEEAWGRRKLAYKIAKQDEAFYFVLYFTLPSSKAPEVNNFCRIDRDVIRHLLLARPEGVEIVDYSKSKTAFAGRVGEVERKERPVAEKKPAAKPAKTEKKAAPVKEEKAEVAAAPVEEVKEVKAEKKAAQDPAKLDKFLEDIDDLKI